MGCRVVDGMDFGPAPLACMVLSPEELKARLSRYSARARKWLPLFEDGKAEKRFHGNVTALIRCAHCGREDDRHRVFTDPDWVRVRSSDGLKSRYYCPRCRPDVGPREKVFTGLVKSDAAYARFAQRAIELLAKHGELGAEDLFGLAPEVSVWNVRKCLDFLVRMGLADKRKIQDGPSRRAVWFLTEKSRRAFA